MIIHHVAPRYALVAVTVLSMVLVPALAASPPSAAAEPERVAASGGESGADSSGDDSESGADGEPAQAQADGEPGPPDDGGSERGDRSRTASEDGDERDGGAQPNEGDDGRGNTAESRESADERASSQEGGAHQGDAAGDGEPDAEAPDQGGGEPGADGESGQVDGEPDAGAPDQGGGEPGADGDPDGGNGEPDPAGGADDGEKGDDDPAHGNVGSVKVAPVGGEGAPPGTQPHIDGCAFDILIHGRGEPDEVTAHIAAVAPTGDAHLQTATIPLGGDAPPSGREVSGRATVDIASTLSDLVAEGELTAHDQQGFHLAVRVDTPEGGDKHKVFWLDCSLPDQDEDTAAPADGEDDTTPADGEDDTTPDDGEDTDADEAPAGKLVVRKETAGDAPAAPFRFVIECADTEWSSTVAAGEATDPMAISLDADDGSVVCTVRETETRGADDVTVVGGTLTGDGPPQALVAVGAGELVELVFVNAFADDGVAVDEGEPPEPDAPDQPAGTEPSEAEDPGTPSEGEGPGTPSEAEGPQEPSEVDAPAESEGGATDEAALDELLVGGDAPGDEADEAGAAEDGEPASRERRFEAAETDARVVADGRAATAGDGAALAETGLPLRTQAVLALAAIGAGATLLTLTGVRRRRWGDRLAQR